MQTPTKSTYRVLNGSFTPFSSLASSKVSTNCEIQREDSSSIGKKRFTRRREGSSDSLRRLKTHQTERKIPKKQTAEMPQNIEESFQKADKLLQKLSFKKQSIQTSRYVKLPTDRSIQCEDELKMSTSIILPSSGQRTSRTKTQQSIQMDFQANDLRMQLEMKNNEYMILEDHLARVKRELKQKDSLISKLEKDKETMVTESQQKLKKSNDLILKLQTLLNDKEKGLKQKDQQIEKLEKSIIKYKQQLRRAQKQIQLLRIHMQQLTSKKVPKNALQMMSYREISLQNQLNELKTQLSQSKTQKTLYLQQQLQELHQKLSQVHHNNQNLSIANRILTKKNQDMDLSMQKKFRIEVNELKQKMKEMIKQTSVLKKQNVSLRKTIYQQKQSKEKTQQQKVLPLNIQKRSNRLLSNKLNKQNSSDQSFSISLSK